MIRKGEAYPIVDKSRTMSELKTCFKKVDYDLSGLLHYIDIGDIALPDIQRPFVSSKANCATCSTHCIGAIGRNF